MTLIAFFLVLVSAILHAGWNLLSKQNNPSAAFYLLSSSTAAVLCLCCAGGFGIDFTLLPLKFSLLLAVSILFEALYLIGLAHAYRNCDISIAYPMGRAMPVLLVAAVTLLLGLGTTPGKIALTGMGILFLGCLLLLAAYLALFYSIIRTAFLTVDPFGRYLAVGIAGIFFTHCFINIGMSIGLAPVTGLSLPFVSYGGSFMLMGLAACGLLQSVYRYRNSR